LPFLCGLPYPRTDPAIVSYRAVEAFQKMIDLVPRMSEIVARTVMVRGNAALP
jgi:hypothetical protein